METPLQESIHASGKRIFEAVKNSKTPLFSKDRWYRSVMEWSMQNEHFKTQMFRFVDVLPYLRTNNEVTLHLKEYFSDREGKLPAFFGVGLGIGSLAPGLMAGMIKKNVEQMAKMFITGSTPQEAIPRLEEGHRMQKAFTIDLLGEATLSEKEALDYQRRYLELIDSLSAVSESWASVPVLDEDNKGAIPRNNVSVKLSSLYSQIKSTAWDASKEVLKERLRPIFSLAVKKGVFINLDMEQYSMKDLTIEVFCEILREPEFCDYPHWGIVIQAYLRDSFEDVKHLTAFAQEHGSLFTIRLVKGAYWDYETVIADQKKWPIPVYMNKQESDANFEVCARYLLDNHAVIKLAVGSHNIRSLAATMEYARSIGLPKNALEIQMIYGMADPIKAAIVGEGYRLREYATVGEMIPGMAYLVRRLLENTSNESFLRSRFEHSASSDMLLKDPAEGLSSSSATSLTRSFQNHALLDFVCPENRGMFERALEHCEGRLGQEHCLVIGGKRIKTGNLLASANPSHPERVVGSVHVAAEKEAEAAVNAALKAFPSWRDVSVENRAQVLECVAEILDRDRFNLATTQVNEVGKTWAEADADICEAIDFCRYYAMDIRRLEDSKRIGHVQGEHNEYSYGPRGVTVVIAPWNFPLAILAGMVTAAVVTGNTVVMKPAEQSMVVASEFMEILEEAGVPPGVVNFLPGLGEIAGRYLVKHKDVATICFTGSKDVGLEILQAANTFVPGQQQIKGCITELGGKNALIVDSDADPDEAIPAITYSAFGFAGQKCSALSRLIVLEPMYDILVPRLLERMQSLKMSFAEDPDAYCGPVIDAQAHEKIMATIAKAKNEATLAFQGTVPQEGYFVPMTIFTDVDPQMAIAREEIFGPVLAIIKAKDLDEALAIANDSEYALTGGVFSRSPATIERCKKELNVGNLYINRGITGAMVERNPFGGFKLSGVGSKTGGPDYLKQFMEPRASAENTLRRGFAPSEEN